MGWTFHLINLEIPMTALTLVAFDAFLATLASFDWYYEFSDDGRVYRRGKEAHRNIKIVASKHPHLHAAYSAFEACHYNESTSFEQRVITRTNTITELRSIVEANHKDCTRVRVFETAHA